MLTNRFLHRLDVLYSLLVSFGSNLQSLLLLYMRLVWGHQFLVFGLKKWQNIDAVATSFHALGIGAPTFNAYLVASVETVCGFLLVIGFASRLAAIPLAITMLVALSTAHASNLSDWQFLTNPLLLVKEAPYPFLLTSLMVFVFGPGRISIDGWVKRWIDRQPRY